MKKTICFLITAAMICSLAMLATSCDKDKNDTDSTSTVTVAVTDKNGKSVTKTVAVTDKSGTAVTEKDGTAVTKSVAVTETKTVTVKSTSGSKNSETSKQTTAAGTKTAETSKTGNASSTSTAAKATTKTTTAAATKTTTKATTKAAATTQPATQATTARKTGFAQAELVPEMITLVNQARAAQGLNQAANDPALDAVCLKRAVEAAEDEIASPGSMHKRVSNYAILDGGECAAAVPSYDTAQDTFDGWMNSAGHRYTIMSDRTQYGYSKLYGACAKVYSYDTGRTYWVLDFEIAE